MTRLVADLLDYTRTRLGAGIPIERSACDVGDVCREAVDSIQSSYPGHEFVLSTSGDLTADVDSAKLEQALGNLLANAAQHGEAGGQVGLSVSGCADAIVLRVSNKGSPIPTEALRSVFEPLIQVQNLRTTPTNAPRRAWAWDSSSCGRS